MRVRPVRPMGTQEAAAVGVPAVLYRSVAMGMPATPGQNCAAATRLPSAAKSMNLAPTLLMSATENLPVMSSSPG